MKDTQSDFVFQVVNQLIDQVPKDAETVSLYVLKRDSVVVELELILFNNAQKSYQPGINALFVV